SVLVGGGARGPDVGAAHTVRGGGRGRRHGAVAAVVDPAGRARHLVPAVRGALPRAQHGPGGGAARRTGSGTCTGRTNSPGGAAVAAARRAGRAGARAVQQLLRRRGRAGGAGHAPAARRGARQRVIRIRRVSVTWSTSDTRTVIFMVQVPSSGRTRSLVAPGRPRAVRRGSMGPMSFSWRVKGRRTSGTIARAPEGPKVTAWTPFSPTRPGSRVSCTVPLPPGTPMS